MATTLPKKDWKFGVTIEFKFVDIVATFFVEKKSKDENWPSGGVHLDFRIWSVSKVSLFEVLESSSLS